MELRDRQEMSLDIKTPRNVYLSAFYKRSFAYHTIKHRLPIILTKLIDSLVRNKKLIADLYGEESSNSLKIVIGELSRLKYEIQTNKPLENLSTVESKQYNEQIAKQCVEDGHVTYFNTIWLLAECYMYQRINEIFVLTEVLKNYDYFGDLKTESHHNALHLMVPLADYLITVKTQTTAEQKKDAFISLLKMNLWGNKCDLSLSLAKQIELNNLGSELDDNILVNDSEVIWNALNSSSIINSNGVDLVDIVLDNAGYELFTDFCLADYLINQNLCKIVRFHVKLIPWFISDVTKRDYLWTIQELKKNTNESIKQLGIRWEEFNNEGKWQMIEHPFWTLPFQYKLMKTINVDLYQMLAGSKLIIFKGDLNYRKLFGEFNWDPTTPINIALEGFHPSQLCTLRTIKAEIVVGLKDGVADKLDAHVPNWMETGNYGLIQFCDKILKL